LWTTARARRWLPLDPQQSHAGSRPACGERFQRPEHRQTGGRAAIAKGIKAVVFDRGGARYHSSKGKDGKPVQGKLAALADARARRVCNSNA